MKYGCRRNGCSLSPFMYIQFSFATPLNAVKFILCACAEHSMRTIVVNFLHKMPYDIILDYVAIV